MVSLSPNHALDPMLPFPLPSSGPATPLLVAPLDQLLGREREVTATGNLLRDPSVRLLTLMGPGGVGKTRLALQVAKEVAADFPDGVRFVPLASVRDATLVVSTIAQAVAVRETGHRPLAEGIIGFLREKQTLLILDNFEHVVEAAPRLVELLGACPRLTCMVTSRTLLRVSGEHAFPVPPLPLPPVAQKTTADRANASPAVRLFVARAQAAHPDFTLTDTNAGDVEGICRRLDGLPLALELAAVRVRHLTPAELTARIGSGGTGSALRMLTGGARDAPDRQQTLRYAISWSYDLLEAAERTLFCRLAAFVGGFTLEAAEAVAHAGSDGERHVSEGIASLVDQSLLVREEGPGGASRYLMLETIREFALEQLAASGEERAVRDAQATYFLGLAEQAAPELHRHDQRAWLDRLETDHANMRAALDWLDQSGHHEELVRMVWALLFFWWYGGYNAEGRAWLDRALGAPIEPSHPIRSWIAFGAGMLAINVGQIERMKKLALESQAIARRNGLQAAEGAASMILAWSALLQENTPDAVKFCGEAETLLRRSGDNVWIANILGDIGLILFAGGQVERGMALIDEALALDRHRGNRYFAAVRLSDLGLAAQDTGDVETAVEHFLESARLLLEIGEVWYLASPLAGLAAPAVSADPARAARLLGASEALRSRSGIAQWPTEQERDERTAATARILLGTVAFDREWAVGQTLTPAEALTEAEAVATSALRPDERSTLLSAREFEVLRLLVAGQSDREIAEALFISPRTASKHVGAILAKLEVSSRAEAAVQAVRDHLV